MKLKTYPILAALVLAGAFAAIPASAATCLRTQDIVGSNSKDGKTIDFTMRDGKIYKNHLQGICSDLKFNGFVWVIRGPEEVCENQQSLRVLQSGQVCVLGKFDPPTTRVKPAAPANPG